MAYLLGVYGMIVLMGLAIALVLTAALTAASYAHAAISLCVARAKSHGHSIRARTVREHRIAH